jgi:hypothetical protein
VASPAETVADVIHNYEFSGTLSDSIGGVTLIPNVLYSPDASHLAYSMARSLHVASVSPSCRHHHGLHEAVFLIQTVPVTQPAPARQD